MAGELCDGRIPRAVPEKDTLFELIDRREIGSRKNVRAKGSGLFRFHCQRRLLNTNDIQRRFLRYQYGKMIRLRHTSMRRSHVRNETDGRFPILLFRLAGKGYE
jgi:hypothetical protein